MANAKNRKHSVKNVVNAMVIVLTLIVSCIGQTLAAVNVQAATPTNHVPITCYPIKNARYATWASVNGKVTGHIDGGDKCTILETYENGWCKVRYPVSGGRTKTAYSWMEFFFSNTQFSPSEALAGSNMKVFPRADCQGNLGTVYSNDKVIITGTSGNATQILYPISGGYKLGWVSASVTQSPNTAGRTVALNVPSYKQYDGRWSGVKIGTKNIGQIGCLLTSLAMKYSYQTNSAVYPNVMKSRLRFNNNDLYWSSVSNLGYTYTANKNCSINNTIMKQIYSQLKNGKPVIIGGKTGSRTHWVVVTGYRGTSDSSFRASDFTINDPNSSARTTLNQFTATYPTILRLIY